MFGYIKTYKPEMRMREYEAYRAVYCSLCKELGRGFGVFSRFTLNYDDTFLAVLKMSLTDENPCFKKCRCGFNPFVKCGCCGGGQKELSFSANAAMIMIYYKIKDNLHDDTFWHKIPMWLLYPFAAHAHKKAAARYPAVEQTVSRYIAEQARVESDPDTVLDAAAEPTARALAELFSMDCEDECQSLVLNRLGYCIGRWVYLMDAADDLEEDIEKRNFNPFLLAYGIPEPEKVSQTVAEIRKYAQGVLNLTAGEAAKAFELLNTYKFREILHNIIYLGLAQSQENVLMKRGGKNE